MCPPAAVERLRGLLARAGLPDRVEGLDVGRVLDLMQHDKKFITGQNRFVLLTGLGRWAEQVGVPEDVIERAAREVIA
jgi:3-dehydroquinate synthetase